MRPGDGKCLCLMSLLTAAVTSALEGATEALGLGDAAGVADELGEEQALAVIDKAITRTTPILSISALERMLPLLSFGPTHRG